MKTLPEGINYNSQELTKLHALRDLFEEFHSKASGMNFPLKTNRDQIVVDGFYPGYFDQRVKVLFVGREARDIEGANYIDSVFHGYTKDKMLGVHHLEKLAFHKRLFYIAYGLINPGTPWNKVPRITELVESFGTAQGISFAFINLTKLANPNSSWATDWKVVDAYLEEANRVMPDFLNREISILEPDLIITMNIGQTRLKMLGELEKVSCSKELDIYRILVNDKPTLLFNTFHFSATSKKDYDDYYAPVVESYKVYSGT